MLQRLGPGTGVRTVAVDERTVHVEKHRAVVERHVMRLSTFYASLHRVEGFEALQARGCVGSFRQ